MIECKIEKGHMRISGKGDILELLTEASIIALDTIGRCSKDEESFYRNKNIVISQLAKQRYEDFNAAEKAKNGTEAEDDNS